MRYRDAKPDRGRTIPAWDQHDLEGAAPASFPVLDHDSAAGAGNSGQRRTGSPVDAEMTGNGAARMEADGVRSATVGGRRMSRNGPVGTVVDLFCGGGALSHGFLLEGFSIACGYDIDESCRFPFEKNNEAPFVRRDVTEINHVELAEEFSPELPRVLIGCAPCQPFSRYSQGREDPKWQLLRDFARLAVDVDPDIVTMENVPHLVRFKGGRVFNDFVGSLREAGYRVRWAIANCPDFGVPQSRSRLVLIGSKHGKPKLPERTHASGDHATVSQTIGNMPPLAAGQVDTVDRLHCASGLSELNLKRIRASRPGGTWREWSPELVAKCHKKHKGRGYASVYGRMRWDRPSPTITTQFYGFGNGRFGHPEQDRALSLREGAMLQTFPADYTFIRPGESLHFTRIGRMIGNAVPVRLAQAIARAIKTHLRECES